MNRRETAKYRFKQGFNCSQAILAAYASELGMHGDTALKIASAFGGGIGRMGKTCGAVTGALMVIGLKYGATDAKDKASKAKTYGLVQEFVKEFSSLNSSISCRELLGFDIGAADVSNPEVRRNIEEKCSKYITDASEIIEKIIENKRYNQTHKL